MVDGIPTGDDIGWVEVWSAKTWLDVPHAEKDEAKARIMVGDRGPQAAVLDELVEWWQDLSRARDQFAGCSRSSTAAMGPHVLCWTSSLRSSKEMKL